MFARIRYCDMVQVTNVLGDDWLESLEDCHLLFTDHLSEGMVRGSAERNRDLRLIGSPEFVAFLLLLLFLGHVA